MNVNCVDKDGNSAVSVIYKWKTVVIFDGFALNEASPADGYEFRGWNVGGKLYPSKEDAENAIRELALTETDITVTEVFGQKAHTYTDEQLVQWSAKDYQDKTGTADVTADISEKSDDKYSIVLRDTDGNVLDTYTVDPDTGTGTNSGNEAVDLPQTGMSGTHKALAGLAALMVLAGAGLVKKSRKDSEE